MIRRIGLLSVLAGFVAAANASPAGAAVTIGQTGPVTGLCSQDQDWAQQIVSSGVPYIVPPIPPATSLTITSWSHQASSTPNQQIKFRVYRPVMGLTYQVVAQDVHSLTPSVLNTFPADVRVASGDILGISNGPDTPLMGCGIGAFSETDLVNGTSNAGPGLAPGDNVTFNTIGGARLDVSAVVEPTNKFTLGALTRNKKKGTATLNLSLPNPGELVGSGNGANVASTGTAGISKSVGTGAAQLLIKAKGKKKKKLNQKGRVKLNVAITYTPTGGSPNTQSVDVKLKKK